MKKKKKGGGRVERTILAEAQLEDTLPPGQYRHQSRKNLIQTEEYSKTPKNSDEARPES